MTQTVDAPAPDEALDVEPRILGIQVEAKLREWNVRYEYVDDYPIADVRSVEWTQVRGKENVADPESVAEFKTQMSQGAVYPPIVLMHPDQLVDGNTRLAAAKGLRRKTFPAFVAHFNSVDLARTFGAAVNQLGGRRLTPVEAYRAAVTMMDRGMADEAVAREIGRSVEMVRQMRRKKEYTERTAALPEIARMAGSVSERAQIKLAQIAHDPAFAEAVKVVAETKPPAKVVSEIVRAATTARTDTDAIEAVRAIRAELAPAGPPPYRVVTPPEVRQSRAHLGGLLKYAEKPSCLLDQVSPEQREESIARWQKLRDLATEVVRLYNAA